MREKVYLTHTTVEPVSRPKSGQSPCCIAAARTNPEVLGPGAGLQKGSRKDILICLNTAGQSGGKVRAQRYGALVISSCPDCRGALLGDLLRVSLKCQRLFRSICKDRMDLSVALLLGDFAPTQLLIQAGGLGGRRGTQLPTQQVHQGLVLPQGEARFTEAGVTAHQFAVGALQ